MNIDKLIQNIEKKNEQLKQERNEQFRDRIKYGAKETLDYFGRKLNQGYTPKEILKDLEKSKYK